MKNKLIKNIFLFLNLIIPFFLIAKPLTNTDVQRIFTDLTIAVGDKSQSLPKVVIRPQKRFGASYKRSENTIFIEQAVLDICNTFVEDAENAVAFLLGHELTHYYQKHDWQEAGFTTGFLTSLEIFQKNIHHEKEADTYSAFITHLAGYNSIKILPQLLENIYQEYGLKGKELKNYPSLTERKALANEVCKTVQGLIDIYQVGNYLYALGRYEDALVNYEYLLKYVKYKELYNNIGLCALYAALPAIQRDFPFEYPLTLDSTIPLRAPSGFTKEELMQKAINNFSIATTYDASYFISYLNLICAYDLNNQFQEIRPLLNSIQNLAIQPKEHQQLNILEGIQAFRKQRKTIANDYFSKVVNNATFPDLVNIANSNIAIINGQYLDKIEKHQLPFLEDKIEEVSLLFYEGANKENYIIRDVPLDKKYISIQTLKSSKVYIFKSNGQITKFHFTKSFKEKTSQNISIGATINQIELAYPNTTKRFVSHMNGSYLLLDNKGLLFNLDKNNHVIEWGVFVN